MSTLEDLRAQPLLEGVGEERLGRLAGQVEVRTLAPGEVLFGEEAGELRSFAGDHGAPRSGGQPAAGFAGSRSLTPWGAP